MEKCEKCGNEFEPREPWHRLCDACYQGPFVPGPKDQGRRRRAHPQMVWLERPELVLLIVAIGVVLLVVIRGCGG